MLILLRSKGGSLATKIIFAFLLLLIIPSFIFWGASTRSPEFQKEVEVATVGNIEISADQLRRAVDRESKQMQRQSATPLDPQLLRQLGVVDGVLNQLIERAAFASYGRALNMMRLDDPVMADMATAAIQSDPHFRGVGGAFDPNRYQMALEDAGFSDEEYRRQLRQILTAAPISVAIQVGTQVPKSLAETLYAYRNEQRVAQTLLIPDSSITDVATPDDAAIAQFHKDHPANYQAPEYRGLTIVRLRPEDRAGTIKISEDQVKTEYEARKAEFDVPAKRKVAQAVIADEAAAKDLVSKVRAGTPFADAVKAVINADPLDLGEFGKAEDLQNALANVVADTAGAKQLADAIFAGKQGDVTDPVKGPLGWPVFGIVEATDPHVQTLADVHDKLAHDLALRQAASELVDVGNQLQDELAARTTLVDAAGKFGLPVQKIDAVDKTGKAPDGKDVDAVKGDAQVLSIAFDTPEGEDSPLTDAPDGGFAILHVDGIRPAATRPLAEVRDKVISDWQAAERQKAVGAKAQKIVERIQGGEAIDKIAAELNATVSTSQPFKRDTGDVSANISAQLAALLFAAKVGDAATARGISDDGEVVARLTEIKPVDLAAAKTDVADLQKKLRGEIAGDIYDQFNAVVQKKIGVSKDQAAIDSLYK